MNQALQPVELKELGINTVQYRLLTDQIAPGATPDELRLFLLTAQRTGLDPFRRQIYLIARNDNRTHTVKRTPQTSIDGFRAIAARSGKYAGSADPRFDNEAAPRIATVAVWRLEAGTRCQFDASARWDQYYPGRDGWKPGMPLPVQPDASGFMWRKMPHVMLGKVAEALALRKAFPEDLSGLYTEEEMDQSGKAELIKVVAEVKPEVLPEPPKDVPGPMGSATVPMPPAQAGRPMTMPQRGLITQLLKEKRGETIQAYEKLNSFEASNLIKQLMSEPAKQPMADPGRDDQGYAEAGEGAYDNSKHGEQPINLEAIPF